ncbi:MAG: 16S rRNA (cytidine(1402)-2'-O)-methyltransferase, partial [Bacteroidia bacterium]|nr:16S rRNA (cytidine(1402)-2'-O)-methyltransferase [Bacteroidia bacterium]
MADQGKLYLVPTPVGNLKDITLRALEILQSCDVILAEDTRNSGILLKHYNITKPLWSFHSHNEHQKTAQIISDIQGGQTMALITDAGTPGISDPGFLITRECIKANVHVECLPGATACIPALVKSGLPADRFVFEGFIPVKKGRQTRLKSLENETRTMIFYESPYKLLKFLED